ncbi:MAG: glycosyltransferase [Bacteroidales bacterium]|nr:glycosyltransferase [Bacteroidales bacterium]
MSKILFVTSRFPYPLSKGDKLRVYFQLKCLSKNNVIHLIAINENNVINEHVQILSPFCKSINIFSTSKTKRLLSIATSFFKRWPFQIGYFYNSAINKKIKKLITEIEPDYIHCHLIRAAEYVKEFSGIEKSLDYMDAFSIGMKKRADIEKNPFKKLLFLYEYKRLEKYEASMFEYFNRFSIISNQDRIAIKHPRASEIKVVPNGVDFDSFYPRNSKKLYDICFMGNMSYPPNIDAVHYTINQIFPLLIKRKAEIKFLIAGISPPKSIKALQSLNIDIIENFNHISDSIAMSKVIISPMIVSIGLQNKIIQAMAMKVPNVVSKSANNAIQATHGQTILEANTPDEYVNNILLLLNDEEKRLNLTEDAYNFVIKKYNWEIVNTILENTIKGSNI